MYFANIVEIDGYQIINGMHKKQIDQVRTNKLISMPLSETKEFKAIKGRMDQTKVYNQNIAKYKKQMDMVIETAAIFNGIPKQAITENELTAEQKRKIQDLKDKVKFNNDQIFELQKDFPALNKALNEKRKQMTIENAIYFDQTGNTISISDDQYKKLKQDIIDNQRKTKATGIKLLLTSTGEIIEDYRGKEVFMCVDGIWESRIIDNLNDKPDAIEILKESLTIEQQKEIAQQAENERIKSLTDEEKQNEKTVLAERLLNDSIAMKNKLEIQGDDQALQKSKDWYNAEIEKLNFIYG